MGFDNCKINLKNFFLIVSIINFFFINKASKIAISKLNLNSVRREIFYYNKFDYSNFKYKTFNKIEKPKISVIITLYNQKNYILKIYLCILKQSLKEIEIVFIDDASTDNSFLDLEKLMEKDQRIVYLKNKKNRGQFFSRNKGILHSKGEYALIIDPDDLLLNNILIKSYKKAIKFNLDIVQFYHLFGTIEKNKLMIINENPKEICIQPETNKIFFESKTRFLWDKLIKRNVLIRSIYFMKKKFRKERFIIHNDDTACFGIFKSAYSYGQLKEVGYFYNNGSINSTTKQNYLPDYINGRFHSIFSTMDYYFEQSEDNEYEKIKGGYTFFKRWIVMSYGHKIKFLTKGFRYIKKVLVKYIKSPFFNSTQKKFLKKFKKKIEKQESIQKKRISFKAQIYI